MVIDLTIHSQHLLTVRAVKGLSSAFRVNDAQSLVSKDGRAAAIYSTPVRPAMTDFLTHLQCLVTQSLCLLFDVQYCYYSTHNLLYFYRYDKYR